MRSLPDLLAAACFEPIESAYFSWDRIILLNNVAVVPASGAGFPRSFDWNTGFHLAVLGPDGHPRYYCKVGAAQDSHLDRENRILSLLCRDPDLAQIVPRTSWARSPELIVQVSAFLDGKPFGAGDPRLRHGSWTRSLAEILEVNDRVSAAARETLGEFCGRERDVVALEEAAWALDYLASAGLTDAELDLFRSVLDAAGKLPRSPQHGDLWSGNVIRSDARWWLIDFASYGTVRVPLYDVLHCLQVSLTERLMPTTRNAEESWRSRMQQANPFASASRRLLREYVARNGLGAPQLRGAIVFYVVDFAARIRRRNVGVVDLGNGDLRPAMSERMRPIWEPYLREVRSLATALRRQEDPCSIAAAD
jgi:hypothetical protein